MYLNRLVSFCIRGLVATLAAALLTFAFLERSVCAEDFSLEAGLLSNGVPWIEIAERTNYWSGYQVEVSTNLESWSPFGKFLHFLGPYRDNGAQAQPQRYFRAFETPLPASTNQIANQLNAWNFYSKFLIFTNDPQKIYFHDAFMLHYDAASRHFPEIAKLGPEGFDAKSIHPANQQIVLGGIVPQPNQEKTFGIEFVGAEPYSPARLVELFKTVTNRIYFPDYVPFLLPSSSQLDVVLGNLEYFKREGVPVRQWKDFRTNSTIQSEGWTIGTLKYIPSKDLAAAIARGELTPDTILLTDEVPRDLPPVAGLISLSSSSPNSHTVIRLSSHALPYYDFPTALTTDLTNLIGQKILFATQSLTPRQYVDPSWMPPPTRIYLQKFEDVPTVLRSELQARQTARGSQRAPAMERAGVYWKDTVLLTRADAKYFGSKAAHYGLLRKAIPEASEPAIALSFDLWLDFMEQKLPSGKTLREGINEEIASATNSPLLSERLEKVRNLITDTASFTEAQRTNILSVLSRTPFEPKRKIRFRSSSNAEDLPGFSAAGLYDSYSGCVLDDLQGTDPKVCLCDPGDDKARSVFRAIQKVYASFYNEQAFLERKQYGIDEKTVGMAVLVHHSFPDEEELANGVADLVGLRISGGVDFLPFKIVSQRGAVSVANPDGRDLPETYERRSRDDFDWGRLTQFSSIRPLNTKVLGSQSDYTQLLQLFSKVGLYFDPFAPFRLNFEFKKTAAGLVIKQVRPLLGKTTTKPTLLMPHEGEWETYQGGGVYANFGTPLSIEATHALKSNWKLNFRGGLTSDVFHTLGGLTQAEATYIKGGKIVSNKFVYVSSLWITNGIENGWTYNSSSQRIFGVRRSRFVSMDSADRFDLDFLFQTEASIATPFIKPDDVMIRVVEPGTTNVAQLVPKMPWLSTQVRTNVVNTNGVKITSIYTLGVHPRIPVVGIGPTDGLVAWKETEVAGLTSEPFRLKGNFSQTYFPSRHNFVEYFLFEPGLEPDLPPKIRDELAQTRIKQIYVTAHIQVWNGTYTESSMMDIVELAGFNGERRKL